MNQRSIQGDETAMRKCKTAVVRRWSTGRGIVADRSNPSSVPVDRSLIASTGRHWSRAHCRPVETFPSTGRHSDITESDRVVDWSRNMPTGRQFPEHLSTSRRPPRRPVDRERKNVSSPSDVTKSSYASEASMAHCSYYKACSLREPRTETVLCKGF
ncbi:hypothetical protein M0R45_022249 [Rubus argutus]|uniref:Uncharacterized protein n=1 Tax=Rubus argutus TaxID=59490 RepID=A0AAW1XF33_RUBAR